MREQVSVSPQIQKPAGIEQQPLLGLGDDESDPEEMRAAFVGDDFLKQEEIAPSEGE